MIFTFEEQPTSSSFIASIWRTHSEGIRATAFMSRASTQWQMVMTKYDGETRLTVRGPETRGSLAPIPENAEFIGITFPLGTYMPHWPTSQLVDHEKDFYATNRSFWLGDTALPWPDFEYADVFVDRLVRHRLLVSDPVVNAVLQGSSEVNLSSRSVQRRFLHSTGLTHTAIRQIERAQRAATLLEQGQTIADAIDQMRYADQSHLTRHLKRLIGQTPAQIVRANGLR